MQGRAADRVRSKLNRRINEVRSNSNSQQANKRKADGVRSKLNRRIKKVRSYSESQQANKRKTELGAASRN